MSSPESSPENGYEPITVDDDAGVRAWGPTLGAAFAEAATGVFARMLDPASVEARDSREVRAQGHPVETLLVTWINECLYVHEIEGFVVRRVDVDTCDGGLVHGTLFGEEVDHDRHRLTAAIKAATGRGVEVSGSEGRWRVRVLLER